MRAAKRSCVSATVASARSGPAQLFEVCLHLLASESESLNSQDLNTSCEEFVKFFVGKISQICSAVDAF